MIINNLTITTVFFISFSDALKVHKLEKHRLFFCPDCPDKAGYPRKSSLYRHRKTVHEGSFPLSQVCQLCKISVDTEKEMLEHMSEFHTQDEDFILYNHALRKSIQNYRKIIRLENGIEKLLGDDHLPKIVNFLQNHLAKYPFFRVAFVINTIFASSPHENIAMVHQIPLRTYSRSIMIGTDLKNETISLIHELMNRLENFETNGSGFILKEITSLSLEIFNHPSLRAGRSNLNLTRVPNSKQILNVRNDDELCLLYTIASHFTRHLFADEGNPENYTSWILNNINTDDVNFPSDVLDVKKLVEKNPKLDMKINLFFLQNNEVFPLATNIKNENQEGVNQINLLRVTGKSDEDSEIVSHWLLIKNLDSFLAKTIHCPKRDRKRVKKFCVNCLAQFSEEDSDKFNNHQQMCINKNGQKELYPTSEDRIEFNNYNAKYQTPLIGFYDLGENSFYLFVHIFILKRKKRKS